jgi:hypothetical protein
MVILYLMFIVYFREIKGYIEFIKKEDSYEKRGY